MQNILTLETKKYKIKIDNFEGPLDLFVLLAPARHGIPSITAVNWPGPV